MEGEGIKRTKKVYLGSYTFYDNGSITDKLADWLNEMTAKGAKFFIVPNDGSSDMSLLAFSEAVSQKFVDQINWLQVEHP